MRRISLLLVIALLIAGCANSRPAQEVSLSRTIPMPTPRTQEHPAATQPIRVAAASVISPKETVRSYGALFSYLERQVGRPIELVQRRTYEETYDLLRSGALDLAMVCTYVYVLGKAEIGLELLAAPEVDGRAEYRSLIITRAESEIRRFADLAGKRFAFTDPLSTSGRIYPLSVLKSLGQEPGNFFSSTTYTYSHDNSIKAVVQGVVDAAAVDSLVYEHWLRLNPDQAGELRVIDQSPTLPSPPFVASARLDPELREAFQDALLNMHQDPEGRRILAGLGIDRFVPQTDPMYGPVRELARAVGLLP